MKKIMFFLFALITAMTAYAQERSIMGKPEIDKNVELLSIVFRLAGRPEYNQTFFRTYTDRIEEHFGRYKDHELIEFIKFIIPQTGISYDAVMSMAVHLDDEMNLKKDVNLTANSLDERWENVDMERFVALLKKFSADTGYDEFFEGNADLYEEATERFLPVCEAIDFSWYADFFGKDPGRGEFVVVNALGNGNANYGGDVEYLNGRKRLYAFMGAWSVDDEGMVVFPLDNYLPILIHEFNHSFVNDLTSKHWEALNSSAEKIFAIVGEKMSRQAYTDGETVMNEALVRAVIVKYMKDHLVPQEQLDKQMRLDMNRGFAWIEWLVAELDDYDNNRDIYPTLDDYMPRLAEAYEITAEKLRELDEKRPCIVSIGEFTNGDTYVDAAVKTITINFDRPLSGEGYSVYTGERGNDAVPKIEKIYYTNDNRSVVMEVSLDRGKEYQFVMSGRRFKSVEGVAIKDYEVTFKTLP